MPNFNSRLRLKNVWGRPYEDLLCVNQVLLISHVKNEHVKNQLGDVKNQVLLISHVKYY